MKVFRQGDVFIIKVSKLPAGATKEIPRDNGRVVLAYGEVTGHSHAIADLNALFVVNEQTMQRFLKVDKEPVTLRHEEHAPIKLDAGDYEIRIQREYTPKGIRQVAD